jgi:hypothetical protein
MEKFIMILYDEENGNMAYIVRVEGNRCRGWQVRGPGKRGYHSRLFSDGVHGGPEKARAEAEAYKQEVEKKYPPKPPNLPPYSSTRSRRNTSGVIGVHRSHSYHHESGLKQEYWAAFCPVGPDGKRYMKRFYITDENYSEEQAFQLAVEFRKMWEEAADEGERTLRRFWAEVESGWL